MKSTQQGGIECGDSTIVTLGVGITLLLGLGVGESQSYRGPVELASHSNDQLS